MQVFRAFVFCLALATLGACSSTVELLLPHDPSNVGDALQARPTLQGHAVRQAPGASVPRIYVLRLTDQRQSGKSGSREIGKIRSTVLDMHTDVLALDTNPSDMLTRTLKAQLQLDGLTLSDSAAQADFELSGNLSNLRLDVSGSDEFELVAQLTVRSVPDGKIVWTGQIIEAQERFAGISGNTKDSLNRLLNRGITQWSDKASASLSQHAWGTTRVAATPPAPTPIAAPIPAPAPATARAAPQIHVEPTLAAPGPAKGYGYFSVITMPTRVEVYSDDIYYGLTPLRVMVPTGVMSFDFRFDGHKSVTQKVLIRKDETTELLLQLQKK